jgi:hypothetical protein
MASNVPFPGNISIAGSLRVDGSISPAKAKSDILAQAELQPFPIPLTSFRVFDAMETLLPNPGLTDDLGLYYGTHGTDTPSLRTEDLGEADATNNSARVLVQLPWEYIAGGSVTLRFMAGMITAVADTTATLDCLVYKQEDDPDDAIGADLCSTSATTMNSLVFAAKDFVITPTGLSPGDILDVLITTALNDDTTAIVIGAISWAHLLCDVR